MWRTGADFPWGPKDSAYYGEDSGYHQLPGLPFVDPGDQPRLGEAAEQEQCVENTELYTETL